MITLILSWLANYQAKLKNKKEVFMTQQRMTTIQVSVETKEQLAKLGIMGDTYDGILQRLLAKVGKKSLKKEEKDG